jgi:hypothetical protein
MFLDWRAELCQHTAAFKKKWFYQPSEPYWRSPRWNETPDLTANSEQGIREQEQGTVKWFNASGMDLSSANRERTYSSIFLQFSPMATNR